MKFGIVGTNFVVDGFVECAKQVADCELVGVCSLGLEEATAFKEKHGILYAYESYQKMFEDKKIEAVYIATPNKTHYEIAKYFLEKHIHVYIEKPMCSNVKEIEKLIALAKENNVYLHDGIMPLYTKNFKILKEKTKEIGIIRAANFTFSKYSSRYDAYLRGENTTTFNQKLSNGAIMDLGVYLVSNAVALFGKPNKIQASPTLLDNGCDGAFTAIFAYDTFNLTLNASKISNSTTLSEISGENGTILFNVPSLISEITILNMKNEELEKFKDDVYPFVYQLQDFIKNASVGRISSQAVPHELTISIHEALVEVRKLCGIEFPADLA